MSATLTTVHHAIIEQLQTHFSDKVSTIQTYSTLPTQIEAPALLLTMEHMAITKGNVDGRPAARCQFSVTAILAVDEIAPEQVAVAYANFAAEVMVLTQYNHWGLGKAVDHPFSISAQPSEFKPSNSGYESWVVTWEQIVYLGELEESATPVPATVYLGESPETGIDHENDYEQL